MELKSLIDQDLRFLSLGEAFEAQESLEVDTQGQPARKTLGPGLDQSELIWAGLSAHID